MELQNEQPPEQPPGGVSAGGNQLTLNLICTESKDELTPELTTTPRARERVETPSGIPLPFATTRHFMFRLDEKTIPAVGAVLGAVVGLTNAVAGWIDRYSVRKKQQREAGHALLLSRLIEDLDRVERAGASVEAVRAVRTKTQAELNSTLYALSDVLDRGYSLGPAPPLSRSQELFLLFKPVGWSAWVAHFLFFSSILVVGMVLLGSFTNDEGDWSYAAMSHNWRDPEMLGALLLYLLVAVISNRWATAERARRRIQLRSKPTRYRNHKNCDDCIHWVSGYCGPGVSGLANNGIQL